GCEREAHARLQPRLEFTLVRRGGNLHASPCAVQRETTLQPANDLEVLAAADALPNLRDGGPEIHGGQRLESGRHHAHHRVWLTVERDRAAHDAGVAIEA